jgi:hypothetical protein
MQDAEPSEGMFEDASVSAPSLEMKMFRRVHFTHYTKSSSESTHVHGSPSTPLVTNIENHPMSQHLVLQCQDFVQ